LVHPQPEVQKFLRRSDVALILCLSRFGGFLLCWIDRLHLSSTGIQGMSSRHQTPDWPTLHACSFMA
jgi:hypothetical protein